ANVTHLGRGPTAAQRIALLWSSPCCDVRGCSSTIGVEADHRLPWADDQVTELPNLDRLCGHHHYLKSHHGWALVPGTGKRPMVPPGDPRHPVDRSRDPACDDPSPKRTVGPAVDREVATEPEDSKPPGPPTRASPRFGDAA
ncbi:MAG: HNH endonuclease signature motif containing protein, partial [Acidimicrobiales bacterium]